MALLERDLELAAPIARGIDDIADKVYSGERITGADALRLFHHPNVVELGQLADLVRTRKHPDNTVSYIVGRNINYTNVCYVRCSFCNFYRIPGAEGGYVCRARPSSRKSRRW